MFIRTRVIFRLLLKRKVAAGGTVDSAGSARQTIINYAFCILETNELVKFGNECKMNWNANGPVKYGVEQSKGIAVKTKRNSIPATNQIGIAFAADNPAISPLRCFNETKRISCYRLSAVSNVLIWFGFGWQKAKAPVYTAFSFCVT